MKSAKAHETEAVLVQWKNDGRGTEVFSSLRKFCRRHGGFDYKTLVHQLEVGHRMFEDEVVRVEAKVIHATPKPDFAKKFFWEFVYDSINWEEGYETVIQRILERGMEKEWKELIRDYGKDKIIKTLKEQIKFLPDGILEEVADYFGIKKEEMRCYIWKQARPRMWI
jgi:hypothetical protein